MHQAEMSSLNSQASMAGLAADNKAHNTKSLSHILLLTFLLFSSSSALHQSRLWRNRSEV